MVLAFMGGGDRPEQGKWEHNPPPSTPSWSLPKKNAKSNIFATLLKNTAMFIFDFEKSGGTPKLILHTKGHGEGWREGTKLAQVPKNPQPMYSFVRSVVGRNAEITLRGGMPK